MKNQKYIIADYSKKILTQLKGAIIAPYGYHWTFKEEHISIEFNNSRVRFFDENQTYDIGDPTFCRGWRWIDINKDSIEFTKYYGAVVNNIKIKGNAKSKLFIVFNTSKGVFKIIFRKKSSQNKFKLMLIDY